MNHDDSAAREVDRLAQELAAAHARMRALESENRGYIARIALMEREWAALCAQAPGGAGVGP